MSERGAVFLDRDDTIVRDPGYLAGRERVEFLPGAIEGLQELSRAGWPLVIASNQSGIARGLYPATAFHGVMDRIHAQLSRAGVRLLAGYYCPHHPEITGPCACRKPETAMFDAAARDFDLAPARSWFLGNRVSDAAPALRLGGKGLVVTQDTNGPEATAARTAGLPVATDLVAASVLVGAPNG